MFLRHTAFVPSGEFSTQGKESPTTGGGRVFSLDATSGPLATARATGAGAILVLSAQPL